MFCLLCFISASSWAGVGGGHMNPQGKKNRQGDTGGQEFSTFGEVKQMEPLARRHTEM